MKVDWGHAREEFGWLAALAGLTLVAFLLASAAGYSAGVPAYKVAFSYIKVIWLMAPAAILLAIVPIGLRALMAKGSGPIDELLGFIKSRFGSPALAAATIAPIMIIPLLMGSFGTLKMLMPLARDFTWDDWLATADRWMFFGYQPWQLTHGLFPGPGFTDFIDIVYSLWVAMLFAAMLFYALVAPRYERARFFLSFAAAWLLIGVAGAYLFASAGPCYAQLVGATTAPEFETLMANLKATHEAGFRLGAYEWQEVLWKHHANREYGFAMGISAMPSMHNAITVLYALSLARASRALRIGAWAYVALIFVGSIHLGWHYAIDGIGAGLMMWAIWAGAGAYLERIGYARAIEGGQADLPDLDGKPVAI